MLIGALVLRHLSMSHRALEGLQQNRAIRLAGSRTTAPDSSHGIVVQLLDGFDARHIYMRSTSKTCLFALSLLLRSRKILTRQTHSQESSVAWACSRR